MSGPTGEGFVEQGMHRFTPKDIEDETRAHHLHTVWVEPWPDRGEYDIAVRHERDGAVWTGVGEGVGDDQIQSDADRRLREQGWRVDGPWKRVGQALRAPVIPDGGR